MRVRYLLLALLAGGCIDLTQPPELRGRDAADEPPDAAAGEDGTAPDLGARDLTASPDAGASGSDAPSLDAPSPEPPPPPDAALPVDASLPRDTAAADVALPQDSSPPPPPDAAPPVDAAPPPDLAPDRTPDLAPDLAPDAAPDLAPDLAPDTGPPVLVIDDFQSVGSKNNLGSPVTWDHETCNRVNGEMVCTYASGPFHDFIETLNSWCGYDASRYRKLRFRMRTSLAGEKVDVYAGNNATGNCSITPVLLGSITTSTTMTTYELDLTGAIAAGKWIVTFEWDPQSLNTTQFIYDDVQLVP
jgi:hypothetical protein